MSQSFWESESQDEGQSAQGLLNTAQEPGTLALSADDFSALEERVVRAVELVKRERLARAAAEERVAQAEDQLREQAPTVERLQKEVKALRAERDHVRQRVERLLAQLDALAL